MALFFAAVLAGCSDVSSQSVKRFDHEVTIVTRISDSGGALGETTYRIAAEFGGESTSFFEGTNPKAFLVYKRGPAQLGVRFCDGNIRLAQPIFVPSGGGRLIHLHVELDCSQPT